MQLKVRAAIDSDDKMAKYNHVMDSYGWKAEIPGDPFSLKPIEQRLPYYVQVPHQAIQVKDKPKRNHFYTPFFYNTIQPIRQSFIIDKNLLSEHLEGKQGVKIDTVYR
ncbi:hypothetical protein EB796_024551 [Bugula neritina]|uniref:Uncharacterized protein n=1 Tax=Bugula neritina TaxID=10212 RepID=A0A7J7IUG9_BUGNE|nr:hypothetical protein EB796_024551 [Bugula neritina]